ncbi:Pimeloyl-ACP methyl ester carboxylesterase [Brevibacterium siliguriense]|uniref:Pimeloyl-ACP methyl ester carboxylesterase n=2 Tax=Brevibacterium siliguriense TaxID=1136497 RepID=A0A1H1Y6Y1_9MICO|nr:Pimeloyl-ACP methyl ester carboxylesterase [Brevibacterium siliguriense]
MQTQLPTITDTTTVVSDLETRYLSGGPEDGTPVVFFHDGAWGGSADVTWGDVLPLAADAGYRVIAPDFLGYGGSAKSVRVDVSPFAFRIRHTFSLLDSLGITGPVHFVGNSFGGSIGLRALSDPANRERIASVTTINGTGGPFKAPDMGKMGAFDGTAESLSTIVDLLGDQSETRAQHLEARLSWASQPGHFITMKAPHTQVPDLIKAERPADPYPGNLADSMVPVLLVQGTADTLLEADWPEKLSASIPTAEVTRVEHGHSPNITHPRETWELISDFLGRAKGAAN